MAIYSKSKIGYVEPWNDQRVTFQKLPNRSYEMSKGPLCPNLTKNSKRKCPNSAIHKAAGRAVPGFAWYNSCGTEKCPLAVNGSRRQERPPEVVLYGGRPYGGFVNSAVNCQSKCAMCDATRWFIKKTSIFWEDPLFWKVLKQPWNCHKVTYFKNDQNTPRGNSAIHKAPGVIPATGSIHGLWEFQELYQAKSWNGWEPWGRRLCE